MRIDNIKGNNVASQAGQVRKLGTQAVSGFTSITRGGFRVGGTAVLLVDSSGGVVIHGQLNGDGTITWTGPVKLNGNTTISQNLTVEALTRLVGELTLEADLNVTGAGKIRAGVVTIGPTLGDGSGGIVAESGDLVLVAPGKISLLSGPAGVEVIDALLVGGYLHAFGGMALEGIGTTTSAANLNVDTGGNLSKVTSAARFKLDPQPMDLPDALLDVPVKDWIDKGADERGETPVRVPGIIAEEVEAAGGQAFVTYDADGAIEGVAYDRLALARTEILARRLEAALTEIAALRRQIGA